jgi:methyl-accepting chemotaxis protein
MITRVDDLSFRWKILLAPAFLMLVLMGLGAYALQMLRINQAGTEALMSGPVLQAEIVADFSTALWTAQARLYRLTATAANETDQKKIKAMAAETSSTLAEVVEKLKAFDAVKTWEGSTAANLDELRTATTTYLKHAKAAIEMTDGEVGAALMFMTSAERSFAVIEKLTDKMTVVSKDFRDREIARSNIKLDEQALLLAGVGLVAILIGCVVSFFVSAGIARPVVKVAAVIKQIAEGNLNVSVPAADRRDEIGIIAAAVQVFKENMTETERLRSDQVEADKRAEAEKKASMHTMADEFQSAVGSIVDMIAVSAAELEATASMLMNTAETTQRLSGAVASTSEKASVNSHSVAAAAEEMSTSVNEIARQVEESSRIAGEAVMQAEKTDVRVTELSQAASHVSEVVKLITAIAGQTNLLALNATIEAARAGEAGKGFAVVAHEVKALASQTAKAAEDITVQISGMQAVTKDSIVAIKDIGATIRKISEIATMIAAQVEEQSSANKQITHNVFQVAQSAAHVSADIADVNRDAGETQAASIQVLSSAKSLTQESNNLKIAVEKFLTTVRAA